jgi:hypothetical protein
MTEPNCRVEQDEAGECPSTDGARQSPPPAGSDLAQDVDQPQDLTNQGASVASRDASAPGDWLSLVVWLIGFFVLSAFVLWDLFAALFLR